MRVECSSNSPQLAEVQRYLGATATYEIRLLADGGLLGQYERCLFANRVADVDDGSISTTAAAAPTLMYSRLPLKVFHTLYTDACAVAV